MTHVPDAFQDRLVRYACNLDYESLPEVAVHDATVRVIDTFGSLIGGFYGEACRTSRAAAALYSSPFAATVIGTRNKSSAEMAAFANATTARFVEMNDVYHWPGSGGGHPSDVIMPIFAVAEALQSTGKELITAVVLAYEVFLRVADACRLHGFDHTNYALLGTVLGCGKLLKLDEEQMAQALTMAVVPNNGLQQARAGHLSMWKAVASGQMGKAAVFAAILAREGMEGPNLPFEGSGGWLKNVAHQDFDLPVMGGEDGAGFKISDTIIKPRSSCATTISSILAAEEAAAKLNDPAEIEKVTVEVYQRAKVGMGTGEHHWNPQTRETADHSIPYVVAATLIDGTVTPRQFADSRLFSSELRQLLPKIEVVENPEFTVDYEKLPIEHRTRVTVNMQNGNFHLGEIRTIKGDLSDPMNDEEISQKFLNLTQDSLGGKNARAILERMWKLDEMRDVSEIPPAFVL
jgi:2-methylcitrate dehydratase